MKSQNLNIKNHSNCSSLYGHFSLIENINDLSKYPNLKKTNPQTYILKEGEGIIIPKNWWHHVESGEKMLGCNFWTSSNLSENPTKINHKIVFDKNKLENEQVLIWKSSQKAIKSPIKSSKFKDWFNSKTSNEYIWTPENYTKFRKNNYIAKKLLPQIPIPKILKNTNNNFEFHFMACNKSHTTNLHYDDQDGVLCVVEGQKKITLFPPEDTKNLYPIEFKKYPWKDSPAIDCVYNLNRIGKKIKGKSSADLLYETCKHNTGVLSSISKVIKTFHGSNNVSNKTIYGFKQSLNEGIYDTKWELYKYNSKTIESYEILNERNKDGKYIPNFMDLYYISTVGENTYKGLVYRKDKKLTKRGNYIIDTYKGFKNNFDSYWGELNYPSNLYNWVKDEVIKKYKTDYFCIHQKNNSEFYCQFIGISNEDFLKFLIEYKYNQDLIDFYSKNDFNISNEIAIVFDKITKKPIRTAFYGII